MEKIMIANETPVEKIYKQMTTTSKETVEEAAEEYAQRKVYRLSEKNDSRANNIANLRKRDFIAGAKWQSEQFKGINLSAIEEMLHVLKLCRNYFDELFKNDKLGVNGGNFAMKIEQAIENATIK